MPKNSQAKARALRIPLLTSTASDRLAWYRNALSAIAVVVCVGWLLTGYLPRKNPNVGFQASLNRYSPGPISSVHANLNCQDCHRDSTPLRNATFLSDWLQNDDVHDLWSRDSDNACKQCHPVSSSSAEVGTRDQLVSVSPHSSNHRLESVGSCASCHAEHRGTDVLPSQVADTSCVACHARLDDVRINNGDIAAKISGFEKDHPPFRSLGRDPGVLKFNHPLHLAAGLADSSAPEITRKNQGDYFDPGGLLTPFQNSNGEIQLDCRFCHQPTNEPAFVSKTNSKQLGTSKDGKFMSMPTYDQNCKICHPLQLEPDPKLAFDNKLEIQHGVGPEQILSDLNVYFSLEAIAPDRVKQQLAKGDFKPPAAIPTRLWNSAAPADDDDSISERVKKAANTVRTTCLRCHFAAPHDTGQGVLRARTMSDAEDDGPGSSGMFNTVFFKHGKFDHAAHRDVSCADCHNYEQNLGKSQLSNLELDKPMIRDLDSCLVCHQSATRVSSPNRAGPTDCISCHTYHGGGNRQ